MNAFMVAAPGTGSGKTTLTLALMAAFLKRGLTVQGFKCGPDFIDPAHHTHLTGRSSRNLDSWMLDRQTNHAIFLNAIEGADVAVMEAMMGLFDGVGGAGEQGSSAEIAKQLNVPVLLVIDASSAARSVAALVHGFETFDPGVKILGVVLNKVGGEGHARLLREAIKSSCSCRVIGSLPYDSRLQLPERHLGLTTAAEQPLSPEQISLLADLAERYLDLGTLLETSANLRRDVACYVSPSHGGCGRLTAGSPSRLRIGVPRDPAFCFYYQDNLDLLQSAGAEIVEFNSLSSKHLPAELDAMYFGGGYPELFAKELSENSSLLGEVRELATVAKPVYAECGGLIYLANELRLDGTAFKMAGVLPISIEMTRNPVNFGYTEVTFERDCLLGERGTIARGHSFHYSKIAASGPLERVYRVYYTLTGRSEPEGFSHFNVLASYIHLHFKSNPVLAEALVEQARAQRKTVVAEA